LAAAIVLGSPLLRSQPWDGHNVAMPIERKNSFHLLLSDDEMRLLRLLAEREGLNASDYLRTMLRRLAGVPAYMAAAMRVTEMVHGRGVLPLAEDEPKEKKRKKGG
jgi:hypothetical protein